MEEWLQKHWAKINEAVFTSVNTPPTSPPPPPFMHFKAFNVGLQNAVTTVLLNNSVINGLSIVSYGWQC